MAPVLLGREGLQASRPIMLLTAVTRFFDIAVVTLIFTALT
ncbi:MULTISPECIES: hypothetical protein [unclassified Caulobacter]|nr:hypothetical protein [Caulobacter sp. UNC358MFTsu5.1]